MSSVYDSENQDIVLPGLPNQFVQAWSARSIKLWTPVARAEEGSYTTELKSSEMTSD